MIRRAVVLSLLPALLVLSVSCGSNDEIDPALIVIQNELQAAVSSGMTMQPESSMFVDAAIEVAQIGCFGALERLDGKPARVLVTLTNTAIATQFLNSGTRLHNVISPAGGGREPVLVIAIEGISDHLDEKDSPGRRSFIFAETVRDPNFTKCLVEDAPLPLAHNNPFYGSFEFEEILVQ